MKLVHVFDAYCGWSYGFATTLLQVTARRPDLHVDVVSGGLFTGTRRVPIRALGPIEATNRKIVELTGAEFGPGYRSLVANGSFVMDSEAAARGMAALRQVAPHRAVALSVALLRAFFVDGHSLSTPYTYDRIATTAGLDAGAVQAALQAPETADAAIDDFRLAAALGVDGYPTLLAVTDDRVTTLARGYATVEQIEQRLSAATTPAPC